MPIWDDIITDSDKEIYLKVGYGFKVGVIEECTFDRVEISHKVNLFDMNANYASVVSITEVKDYLGKL